MCGVHCSTIINTGHLLVVIVYDIPEMIASKIIHSRKYKVEKRNMTLSVFNDRVLNCSSFHFETYMKKNKIFFNLFLLVLFICIAGT